jgi:TatD DNase family protein
LYIDTHCHISKYSNPTKVITDCNYIELIVGVSNGLQSYEKVVNISSNHPNVVAALGFHPHLVVEQSRELELVLSRIESCSVVGEVGLDYHFARDRYLQDLQYEAFVRILSESEKHEKCISIHSNGAEELVMSELEKYNLRSVIFHWYSGPLDLVRRITDNGYYISITPSIAYSKKSQELARTVPLNLLLAESDGPTIHQGIITTPCDIANIVTRISNFRKEDSSEVATAIWTNSKRALDL